MGNWSKAWLKALVTGSSNTGYWYVPFILLTFLLSPLHIAFVRLSIRPQAGILLVSLFIALVVQKPVYDTNPVQAVIAFSPAYLVGLFLSVHRDRSLGILRRADGAIFAAGVGIAACQTALGHYGNYHNSLFAFNGIDLMLLQKLLLAAAFFSFFERLAVLGAAPRLVDLIAQTSFAIYFLHPFAIAAFKRGGVFPVTGQDVPDLMLAAALVVAACAGAALGIKALAGKRSRYLIGY